MVTKETVEQLIEMGFTELRAQKALVKTSNAGIEGAINWLTEHLEDADIDEPIAGEFEVKTAEEIGQAAAEKLAGAARADRSHRHAVAAPPARCGGAAGTLWRRCRHAVAALLRCSRGRAVRFSPYTPGGGSQLTAEEKKAKAEELLAKARAHRASQCQSLAAAAVSGGCSARVSLTCALMLSRSRTR